MQLLNQHWKAEWGNNWCGPPAAGISLGWFAETAAGDDANHANLIEDPGNDGVDSGDKYAAIGTLGMMMGTSSGSGTTDGNFVQGLFNYINSRGLTGDFIIKTFNDPDFWDYSNELSTGEDVLVGITYASGDGHWLVGRSFSTVLNNNGTPGDPLDDYFLVSFVDPGTASVYHTKMRVVDWAIWYMGEWVKFDIMVSVSPTPPGFGPNPGSAQYFIAQNRVGSSGDFTFTLLGDVDPASPHHRTTELTGDANGRIFLARITLRAISPGVATINFGSPDGTASAVNLVMIDGSGDPVLYPPPSLGTPAATIIVG